MADGTVLLEDYLQDVSARSDVDAHEASRLMALRFYLRDLLEARARLTLEACHGATNYHLLALRLRRWAAEHREEVLFVTFNYDTLLEGALADDGWLRITGPASYVSDQSVRVYKLHGSTNWGRRVFVPPAVEGNLGRTRDYVIDRADRLDIGGNLELLTFSQMGVFPQGGGQMITDPIVPAIAIPITNKLVFECPKPHIDTLKASLPRVHRILVIGWRAQERHFLEMLNGLRPRKWLIACGAGEDSARTAASMAGPVTAQELLPIVNSLTFTQLVRGEQLNQLLA